MGPDKAKRLSWTLTEAHEDLTFLRGLGSEVQRYGTWMGRGCLFLARPLHEYFDRAFSRRRKLQVV